MEKDAIILIAEDNEGHAKLIRMNLKRAGINNKVIHFFDGQETLDFLFLKGEGPHREKNVPYILLLDISMPRVDGIEVLRQVKKNNVLNKIPVIIITTTDDPKEIKKCYTMGCNNYITKPIEYNNFVEVLKQLGFFL